MSGEERPDRSEQAPTPAQPDARPFDWRHLARRAAMWIGLAVAVVVIAMLVASLVPRW